ncbi:MAG: hypothetical protein ACHQF2_04075 [Flavobacteriales bacterium]
MPFHYFKTNQPIALIFYAPWAALAWLPHWIQMSDNQSFVEFPYTTLQLSTGFSAWAMSVLGMFCITAQAYQFNYAINRSEMLGRESHIHGAVYVLAASMVYPNGALTDQMISMFLIIPALRKWWSLAEQRQVISICFDSAFLISVASIIYLPNALLLILAFAALMLFRTFNAREAFYLFIGFILPLLFWFSFCFIAQRPWWNYSAQVVNYTWRHEMEWLVWYGSAGLLLLVSVLYYLSITPHQVMRVRKMRSLVFIYLMLSAIALVLYQLLQHKLTFPFMALLPLCVFISGLVNMPVKSKVGLVLLYMTWFTFLYARLHGYFQ